MDATLLRWQGGVKMAEYSIVVVYCAEEGIRMKPGLFVLAVLCLFAAATDGQHETEAEHSKFVALRDHKCDRRDEGESGESGYRLDLNRLATLTYPQTLDGSHS